MEANSSKPTASLEFAVPQINESLKHSIRTQLELFLKAKLTSEQRQLLLHKSFVDVMTLALTDTNVVHQKLAKAFENMYDQSIQSIALAQLIQEQLKRQYVLLWAS